MCGVQNLIFCQCVLDWSCLLRGFYRENKNAGQPTTILFDNQTQKRRWATNNLIDKWCPWLHRRLGQVPVGEKAACKLISWFTGMLNRITLLFIRAYNSCPLFQCDRKIEALMECRYTGYIPKMLCYLFDSRYIFLAHLTIGRCLFFVGMVHAWEVLDITWHCIRQMDFQVLAAVVVHILFPPPLGVKGSFVLLKQRLPDFCDTFIFRKHKSTSCQCWLALNCQVIAHKTSEKLL